MVIMTAKLSKRKLLVIALLAAAIIAILTFCLRSTSAGSGESAVSLRAQTNEERLAYLRSFGWQVQEQPVQTQEVTVPADGNEVFQRYNELQKAQGFDLTRYAGKTLRRYVYEITNYPAEGIYRATLLVYKNEVVGGDVCAAAQGGVIHGFQMPG